MLTDTLAFVIGIGLHAQWSAYTDAQLHARVEQLRAAGEPVLIDDYKANPKAEDDTAAALEAALAAFKENPSDAQGLLDDCEEVRPLLSAWEADQIAKAEQEAAAVLAAIAQARGKPITGTAVPKLTDIQQELSKLNPVRSAANLARFVMFKRAHDGQSTAALETAANLRTLAQYAASRDYLIAYLVNIGIHAVEADALLQVAPTLAIGDAPAASPALVRKTIDRLYDQTELRSALKHSLQAERTQIFYNLTEASVKDAPMPVAMGLDNPWQRYAFRPLLNTNAMGCLDLMTKLIHNSETATDKPTFLEKRIAQATELHERQAASLLVASILLPSVGRATEAQFQLFTQREAAATALAVRWYAAEHNNTLPSKLDDLVPKYLPRVPRDYNTTDQQLGYRAGDKPILWSVGVNDRNDGGVEADPTLSVKEQNETSDEVYPLYVKPRKPAM